MLSPRAVHVEKVDIFTCLAFQGYIQSATLQPTSVVALTLLKYCYIGLLQVGQT